MQYNRGIIPSPAHIPKTIEKKKLKTHTFYVYEDIIIAKGYVIIVNLIKVLNPTASAIFIATRDIKAAKSAVIESTMLNNFKDRSLL